MVAVRLLSRREIENRLAPYGCRLVDTLPDGSELWETGWNEPFILKPEQDGGYDEWQYFQVVANVVGQTKPASWSDGELN